MKFSIEEILRDNKESTKEVHTKVSVSERAHERLASDSQFRKEVENAANKLEYENDDFIDISAHRRARTTITGWQRDKLEEIFTKQRYPTLDKVEQLSEQLGLPQYVIKVWFQNRRAKFRKEGRKKSNRLLSSTANLPKPQLTSFTPPCLPLFNTLQHLHLTALPVQPDVTTMNRLISRCPLSVDSLGHDISRLRKSTETQMSPKAGGVVHQETSLHATYCDQGEIQQRLALCHIEREKSQAHPCCCMNCRLGTYYTKY